MRTGDPLVSIVTPTLQRADLLESTLRSVRAQSYATVEHIVVDGGSTDGSLELLRRYEQTYNLRWLSEPDLGMYDAINKGLQMARGEILAYLNSDDLYFPWTVDVAVRAFLKDPTVGLVFGDALRLDERDGSLSPWFQPPFRLEDMIAAGSFVQPTVFWQRRLVQSVGGFDTSLRFVGDLDFWLRAGRIEKLARIEEMLAVDRLHGQAASVVAGVTMTAEADAVRRRYGAHSRRDVAVAAARAWLGRRVLWLRFVASSRRQDRHRAWGRILDAGQAHIGFPIAMLGLLPRIGMRYRLSIHWKVDPVSLATGAFSDDDPIPPRHR